MLIRAFNGGTVEPEKVIERLGAYRAFLQYMGNLEGDKRRFIRNMAVVAHECIHGTKTYEIPEPEGSAAHQGGPAFDAESRVSRINAPDPKLKFIPPEVHEAAHQ